MPDEGQDVEQIETSDGTSIARKFGAVLVDEAVNAVGILTIGYVTIATHPEQVPYEPIAAIATIALGAKYIAKKGGNP